MLRNLTRTLHTMTKYTVRQIGQPGTAAYAAYLQNESNQLISPFHDIPLKNGSDFNMVVEVPRWTNAKLEISKDKKLNPIIQDEKKGKLRYVANLFPFKGYQHNYGAIPQTWENPQHKDADTGYFGDQDPVDVCDISQAVSYTGEVKPVKVLGCLAMLDEGETDWKVIAIDTRDPLAEKMNDINDVEEHMPGLLKATVDWFRDYKVPDGKPRNEFAFNGEYKNREYALRVLDLCHQEWKDLVEGKTEDPKINLACTVVDNIKSFDVKHGDDIGEGVVITGKGDVFGDETWYYVSKM